MTLQTGQMLSHYRLAEKIGEGGMGVVWKAFDTKLDREIAIKVLPEDFAEDAERLARFEREAKLLASLSHSNIAAIHGLEEADGVCFLALELVPGQTLAEMLEAGPLPVDEALDLCRQVAEGLEAAHGSGVIHRDLKPGNVKITPEGQAKILDFGLAKGTKGEVGDSGTDVSRSPTVTTPQTRDGMILGTASYMSPEQARGKPLDKRTDIWSFGCLLYECLTGRMAYSGETVTDILSAILQSDPDWLALPDRTPRRVRRLLERCLEKNLRNRLQDIGDARIEMDKALAGHEWTTSGIRAATVTSATPSGAALRFLPWVVAAILAVALGAVTWRQLHILPTESKEMLRLSVDLPLAVEFSTRSHVLALSPDGRRLVLVVSRGGTTQLYLRDLGQPEAVPLPGTEGAWPAFFSPDGEWVGFFDSDDSRLKKVAVRGGAPIVLCDEEVWGGGGSWGADGSIIFTKAIYGGLWRVPASGGTAEMLTEPDASDGELGHWWPQILPGGREVLFTSYRSPIDRARVMVHSLESGNRKTLVEGAVFGRYVPTGHLLYVRGETLFAVPFDLERLEATGPPLPVLDDVGTHPAQAAAQFSFSRNGTLAYISQSILHPPRSLVWVTPDGTEQAVDLEPRTLANPRLSPDGRRLAVSMLVANETDLWVYELSRGIPSRLTFESGLQEHPIWTADGQRLIYSREDVQFDLYWRPADGTGPEELLYSSEYDLFAESVSPDGTVLAFSEGHPETLGDIWVLPLDGDGKPTPFLRTPFAEGAARFSPDGRWLAYESNESGRLEVYVQAFPGPGSKLQVSTDGGSSSVWSRDGKELFYRDDRKMMAVGIDMGPPLTARRPRILFEGRYERHRLSPNYDVARDGRFLMIKTPRELAPRQVNIVLNWFEELKRLVPTDGN